MGVKSKYIQKGKIEREREEVREMGNGSQYTLIEWKIT